MAESDHALVISFADSDSELYQSFSTLAYSHAREAWHNDNCKPSSCTWLLRMEEHSFHSFAIKCVASASLTSRSSLSVKDRGKSLAMSLVVERDLRDELLTLKSLRSPDSLLPYMTSVLEHCKAVINLRVPVEVSSTCHMAPMWTEMPIDDDWDRVMYQDHWARSGRSLKAESSAIFPTSFTKAKLNGNKTGGLASN